MIPPLPGLDGFNTNLAFLHLLQAFILILSAQERHRLLSTTPQNFISNTTGGASSPALFSNSPSVAGAVMGELSELSVLAQLAGMTQALSGLTNAPIGQGYTANSSTSIYSSGPHQNVVDTSATPAVALGSGINSTSTACGMGSSSGMGSNAASGRSVDKGKGVSKSPATGGKAAKDSSSIREIRNTSDPYTSYPRQRLKSPFDEKYALIFFLPLRCL